MNFRMVWGELPLTWGLICLDTPHHQLSLKLSRSEHFCSSHFWWETLALYSPVVKALAWETQFQIPALPNLEGSGRKTFALNHAVTWTWVSDIPGRSYVVTTRLFFPLEVIREPWTNKTFTNQRTLVLIKNGHFNITPFLQKHTKGLVFILVWNKYKFGNLEVWCKMELLPCKQLGIDINGPDLAPFEATDHFYADCRESRIRPK